MRRIRTIRKSAVYIIPALLITWLFFAFSSNVPDSGAYKSFYEYLALHTKYHGVETGFALFMHFCNKAGLDYQQFLMLFSAVGLLLIGSFIQKYTEHPTIVLLCYFFHPFVFDVGQIRNFMASAIFIYATSFLIENKRHAVLKYFIAIMIASLFHRASLVYFILLLTRYEWNKMLKTLVLVCILETAVIFILLKYGSEILSLLAFFSKLSYYVNDESKTRFLTKVFFSFYYCSMAFLIVTFLRCKGFQKYSNRAFILQGCKILTVSFVFFPLLFVSMDFERLTRNVLLIFYMLGINYSSYKIKTKKQTTLAEIIFPIFTLTIIFVLTFFFSFKTVVSPVFKNNLLFTGAYF